MGGLGEGGSPLYNIKKRLEREEKEGLKKEEGPHCNFQANVKFLQNIQILKLLVENIFNFRLFPASFQVYFSFTK